MWSDWPPKTCVKTRSSSSSNQLDRGFDRRLFGRGGKLPNGELGFVPGRNYWNTANNPINASNPDPEKVYGFTDDTPAQDANFHPDDPRLVTIFIVPTNFVITTLDKTVPIVGFVQVYISGYGRINGSGTLTNRRPVHGDQPLPSEYDCQGTDCGNIAWGHIFNWVIVNPSGGPTSPNADPCAPTENLTPACRSWSNSQWRRAPSWADDVLLQCRPHVIPRSCRNRSSTERSKERKPCPIR